MNKQYRCYECETIFENPDCNYYEGERSEGVAEPDDYEDICPNCGSTDFEEINTCLYCGVEIPIDEEYCINCQEDDDV